MGVAGITWKRASLSSSPADGLHRMTLQDPVADVDRMDILLHDDVSGEDAILQPVAQATDRLGSIREAEIDARAIVESLAGNHLAQRPSVDALDQFDKRRRHANLEADI